jgi:hypothetical protein
MDGKIGSIEFYKRGSSSRKGEVDAGTVVDFRRQNLWRFFGEYMDQGGSEAAGGDLGPHIPMAVDKEEGSNSEV